MADRYSCCGKQVLRDGVGFADACDNDAAADIADAMNAAALDTVDDLSDVPRRAARHAVRREGDEYVCRCGIRWDASEGDDHP